METWSVVGAGGGVSPLVGDLGLCLVVAGLLAVAFVRIRIPAIAALLGAGVVLGPAGLEAIQDQESIATISNLGLTLLLFVIGLEVDVRGLLASGRTLVVTGLLQVPLTLAAGFGVFLLVGQPGYVALYFGVACALSSTLLVVKYLQAQRKLDSQAGRLCVGLLIFQDIWAIVFMGLQPSFAHPSVVPILKTFGGTVVVGVLAAIVARVVLPRAFQIVSRAPELVVTVALAWCFGVGLLGVQLDVSLEMGALIAGATIATSPYAYEVVSRVTHLRDFFVTLFFVGLGMSIPIPDGAAVILLAVLLGAVAITLRYLVFLPLLYATGLDRRNAVAVSTKLAQVSEFCLVIAYVGARLGHLDGAAVSVVIFAFVLTALVTPVLFAMSDELYLRLRGVLDAIGIRSRGPRGDAEPERPPRIVILGVHRIAAALLAELQQARGGLLADTLVIDTNAAIHDRIRALGVHVVYGDVSSTEVLRHAGVEKAEVIVSTVPDELLKGTSTAQIVRNVRELAPGAAIIAGSSKWPDVASLRAAGADHVFLAPNLVAAELLPALDAALDGDLAAYVDTVAPRRGAEVLD